MGEGSPKAIGLSWVLRTSLSAFPSLAQGPLSFKGNGLYAFSVFGRMASECRGWGQRLGDCESRPS